MIGTIYGSVFAKAGRMRGCSSLRNSRWLRASATSYAVDRGARKIMERHTGGAESRVAIMLGRSSSLKHGPRFKKG